MLIRSLIGGGALAACLAACSVDSGPDIVQEEDSNLIGGNYLADGDLPSTLQIKGNCTAAKVGPRHILTAAHCVFDSALDPRFADGQPIEVSAAATISAQTPTQRLTIKHTSVAPEWSETCGAPGATCGYTGSNNHNRASDVALIETAEEITNIPIAFVDTEALQPGESVIVAGYGCQGSVGGYWSYSSSNLKAGVVQLLPARATIHSGSTVNSSTLPKIAGHDLITPGPAWQVPGPGLCPGDSGGPLYRAKGGGATIVGVNGSYTFAGAGGGLPVTNWHTRLDTATGRNVGAWLAAVGASTCSGASCPTRVPAASLAGAPPAPGVSAQLLSDGRDVSCMRSVTDTSKVQAAVDQVLSTSSMCMSLNGQRVAAGDSYVYAAVAYCWMRAAPTAEQAAAFPAAMAAKGFPGFKIQGGTVTGQIHTQACDTFPTGDEACQASAPSLEKLAADVKQSTGQKATCYANAPQLVSGYYYVAFACQLEAPLDPQYVEYFNYSMQQLSYTQTSYDATQRLVRGYGFSLPCGMFSSGQ